MCVCVCVASLSTRSAVRLFCPRFPLILVHHLFPHFLNRGTMKRREVVVVECRDVGGRKVGERERE